jgi:hypothetical protein
METGENKSIFVVNPVIQKELGPENLKNITRLSKAIKNEAQKQGIETHVLLVGGSVKPEKQGKTHKDLDLILYSPQLATEMYSGGDSPKFDVFAAFVQDAVKNLNWEIEIEKPWFNEPESSGDGKVILLTEQTPIEVLPVRQDQISNSFEDYKKNETNPFVEIF